MQYILTIFAIFAGELFRKNHVEAEMPENGRKKALGGAVILTKHHNYGAVLNTGEQCPAVIKAISAAVTAAVAAVFIESLGHTGKRTMKWGLSLVLGGGCSNTYDRLKRGYVVDYFCLNVPVKRLKNIVFNAADFCIMIGAVLIALAEMEE